jgi:hypothetical protein
MTADEPHVLRVGGVFIPASACGPLWRTLLAEKRRRERETGASLRPDLVAVMEALRQAAADHEAVSMSACGPIPRTSADTAATSVSPGPLGAGQLTTQQLALALQVTPRHARRMARAAGIDPVARDSWRASDLPTIKENR